jgi:PAS domain S-box-containing protein
LIGALIVLYGLLMMGAAPLIFRSTRKLGKPHWPWWVFSLAIAGVALDRVLQGVAVLQGGDPPFSLWQAFLYVGVGMAVLAGASGLQGFIQLWYDDRERRFQRSIWSSLAEVYLLEPGTLRILDHNRGARGRLPGDGVTGSFEELLASPRDDFRESLRPLEEGSARVVEAAVEFRSPEGPLPVRVTVQVAEDADADEVAEGIPSSAWVAFVADASELRAAQVRLAASAERFQLMTESIDEVIILTDLEGTILYESPRAGPMIGVDPAARVGGNILDSLDPARREEGMASISSLGSGQVDSLDGVLPFVHAVTGERVYLEFKARRVTFPEVGPAILVSGRDVTARVHQDRARAAAEERLRRQQQAVAAIARSDALRTGRVEDVAEMASSAMVELLPVDQASVWLVNGDGTLLQRVIQIDPGGEFDRSTEVVLSLDRYPVYIGALQSGRAVDACDAVNDPRTAELVEDYLVPTGVGALLDASIRVGGLGGCMCAEHLGGPRQWTGEEINFVSELADLVALAIQEHRRREAERERSLLTTQLRMAQRMETLGVMAGGIAHDFNNLLTPILGYAEMALEDMPEGDRHDSALAEIRSAGERAQALVRQLLTFSRQVEQTREPLSLSSLLREVLRLARATLPATIELTTDISEELGAVEGDSSQLHQVFLNLVANAGYAMKEGSGTLSVTLDRLDVSEADAEDLPGLAAGACARVRVADTGVGMDRATVERVFEPFFTTKPQGEGTGLGLAVTHGIVAAHGGIIRVDSTPGEGTVMEVLLPLGEGSAAEGVADPAQDQVAGADLRILVVDDEPAVARFVSRVLERAGYDVSVYTSSVEAAAAVEAGDLRPDLMLTDQTMPGLTGLNLITRVRGTLPDLPVMIMSGYDTALDGPALAEARVHRFLRKPFRGSELLGEVKDVAAALER